MKNSRVASVFCCVWLAFVSAACGGRSELRPGSVSSGGAGGNGTGGMGNLSCSADSECGESDACAARRCVDGVCLSQATPCDDGDVCTEDTCDVVFGCAHRELSLDTDGDGFTGPRAGFAPGAPDSCGADCNDLSAAAFPGNREVCDGVDNDCNGVVDDGMTYVASQLTPIRISTVTNKRAYRGGFTATRDAFVLTYRAVVDVPETAAKDDEGNRALIKGLSPEGRALFEQDVSLLNAETFAGPLAWSGEVLGTAWSDNRQDGNYEIYLGRFDAFGQKLGPNQRVSDAPGFSTNASIQWNQSEFLLAWDDRRREGRIVGDRSDIFIQRAAADGTLLGANTPLVADTFVNENPAIASSGERIGVAYTVSPNADMGGARLGFRVLDSALAGVGVVPEPLGFDVQPPSLHFVGDRFVALWMVYPSGGSPGAAIWGAAFDLEGRMLVSPLPVTSGAGFARSHDAISLGDRLLMIWSDDHDGNFEIYWQILGLDLAVREPRQRLTFTSGDSYNATLAVGPDGKIGVIFNDSPEGSRQVYFTTLECRVRSP